jgi:glycosyltransferase involved in cell wall biosynthesis
MISVIIPTKDRPSALIACLRGLAAQNSLELLSRVVVVDDYSREPYEGLVRRASAEYNLPVTYISNQGVAGAATARNEGAKYAKGDVLAFLDDDAVPTHSWLKAIAEGMLEHKSAAITGRILPLDHHHLFSQARQLRYEIRQCRALARTGPVNFLAGGNAAVWRTDFEQLGGFDPRFKLMHDRDLVFRMAREKKFCFYIHDLVIRHQHYKGLWLTLGQSFTSGYYRLQLERHHPDIKTWSLREQWRSWADLALAAAASSKQILPALIAALTEFLHCCGYLASRYSTYKP